MAAAQKAQLNNKTGQWASALPDRAKTIHSAAIRQAPKPAKRKTSDARQFPVTTFIGPLPLGAIVSHARFASHP